MLPVSSGSISSLNAPANLNMLKSVMLRFQFPGCLQCMENPQNPFQVVSEHLLSSSGYNDKTRGCFLRKGLYELYALVDGRFTSSSMHEVKLKRLIIN